MKIVFLDTKTIGNDIDFTGFENLGEVVKYDFSTSTESRERTRDADVIILNKVQINEESIGDAIQLKLVCVTGTGTNHLDKDYLDSKGIAWRNVAGYSTDSVAQHTFSMLFYLMEQLSYYDNYVRSGGYVNDRMFTHFQQTFHEIHGKTWGIIGLGDIGRRVAEIAKVFGATVIYHSASGAPAQDGYTQVDLPTLLSTSDIVSVHAPLNEHTEGLMNAESFQQMKSSAIFLNLGRGSIVVERDLASALENRTIAAAGLDVLCEEPMSSDSPFLALKDKPYLFITPHIAWASVEARTKLMNIIIEQIDHFFSH